MNPGTEHQTESLNDRNETGRQTSNQQSTASSVEEQDNLRNSHSRLNHHKGEKIIMSDQEKSQNRARQTLRVGNEMCEEEIDYNVMESFPASDPPSWTLGISPLKKLRSDFDSERISIDEPTHQNEPVN